MGAGALRDHLASGATTVARCWALTRRDGQVLGFTDHDQPLEFEGITFEANGGLTAAALERSTGLSVDNTEAVGAICSARVSEADITAGRYDGAEIRAWLVNWTTVEDRVLLFRGSLGELTRQGGMFEAELRGLSEALNQPRGRVFQKSCPAILGDADCGFDLNQAGYFAESAVSHVEEGRVFGLTLAGSFAEGWFARGRLAVKSGAAAGEIGLIRADRIDDGLRIIELWQEIRSGVAAGDLIRLEAGCDKQAATCRNKFANLANYRGFPHLPGDDWSMAYPVSGAGGTGGSLNNG